MVGLIDSVFYSHDRVPLYSRAGQAPRQGAEPIACVLHGLFVSLQALKCSPWSTGLGVPIWEVTHVFFLDLSSEKNLLTRLVNLEFFDSYFGVKFQILCHYFKLDYWKCCMF